METEMEVGMKAEVETEMDVLQSGNGSPDRSPLHGKSIARACHVPSVCSRQTRRRRGEFVRVETVLHMLTMLRWICTFRRCDELVLFRRSLRICMHVMSPCPYRSTGVDPISIVRTWLCSNRAAHASMLGPVPHRLRCAF